MPEAFAAVDKVAAALGVEREVILPEAARARSAAYVITTAEFVRSAPRPAPDPRRRLRS